MSRNSPPTWMSLRQLQDQYAAGSPIHPNVAWLPELVSWISTVIGKPLSGLSRGGALCPFVPPAMERDQLYLSITDSAPDDDALAETMKQHMKQFLEVSPIPPDPSHVYKALLIVFPHLTKEQARLLKRTDVIIKEHLLDHGVTCGDFYPDNEDRSARNSDYRIASSPIPLVAMRYLTPHDEMFLRSQPQLYPAFLRWKEANRL